MLARFRSKQARKRERASTHADATRDEGLGELQVSRVTHLAPVAGGEGGAGHRTRLHVAGVWPTSIANGAHWFMESDIDETNTHMKSWLAEQESNDAA